jgi:hypothetical protein
LRKTEKLQERIIFLARLKRTKVTHADIEQLEKCKISVQLDILIGNYIFLLEYHLTLVKSSPAALVGPIRLEMKTTRSLEI